MKHRPYRMRARAVAVRETRERILSAVQETFQTQDLNDVRLPAISQRSGFSVQTILRHFGSKERLFAEAFEEFTAETWTRMSRVGAGDIRGAIGALHARYEWMGDGNIRMLAQEESVGPIGEVMQRVRDAHREWVERIFDPYLPPQGHADRSKRLYQFLVVCDVYTWKLIRRDHGGDRDTTANAVVELATALVRAKGSGQATRAQGH